MNFRLLIAVAACLLVPACREEAMVSGKPISHWVEKLDDRDPREWTQSFKAFRWCEPEDLEEFREKFQGMAGAGSLDAALLLFHKFDEVDPEWADVYCKTGYSDTYIAGAEALKALASMGAAEGEAARAAVERKLATIDGTDSWHDAMMKLTHEIVAIINKYR